MNTVDAAALARMGRAVAVPFQLALVGYGSRIARFPCEDVLQVHPEQQIVMRGRWRGQQAVAKLYFGRRAHRYCRRVKQGARLLDEAGIAAPKLLGIVASADGFSVLLVFEYLEGQTAVTAAAAGYGMQYRAAREAMQVLHEANLVHQDPHFGNFLVHGERAWLLDIEGIKRKRSRRARRSNLALFLAQLPPLAQQAALSGEDDGEKLAHEVQQKWQRRLRNYAKKVLRECTDIKTWREGKKHIRCRRAALAELPELAALAADPDTGMAAGIMLKNGRSATVVRTPLGTGQLAIKRYNIKGPMHFLRRWLGPSRARRAWRNANMLHHGGIHTPMPLALVEERRLFGLLPSPAWLISRFQEGQTLAEHTAGDALPPGQADRAITRTFLLLRKMHLVHGDMKASNWIISGDKAYLVDLDALRERQRPRARRGQQRDLQRFLHNWHAGSACRCHYEKLLGASL